MRIYMTGYEAYGIYTALKLHFSTDSYDYFRYNGKVNSVSVNSFEARKDRYYFYKLSRRQDTEDYIQFLVSNFIVDNKLWVGKLFEDEALTIHKSRMAIIQSLTYNFQNDCKIIKDASEKFNASLMTTGDYPKLLTMTLQEDINFETLCILNSLMNFLPMWKSKITDTIRYPEFHRTILKYTPFIVFDKDKMKSIALKELQ